jgi:hypothetical protein
MDSQIGPYAEPDQPQPATGPASAVPAGASAEPIIGWRQWRVTDHEGTILLGSMTIRDVWEADLMIGACRRLPGATRPGSRPSAQHPVPDLACTCGVYAHKLYQPRPAVFRAGVYAAGPVALSGRVIEGTRGYRAERGRIAGPLELGMHCTGARKFRSAAEGRCAATYPDGPMPEWTVIEGRRITPMCEAHFAERRANGRYDPPPLPGRPLQRRGREARVLLSSDLLGDITTTLEARYGVPVR